MFNKYNVALLFNSDKFSIGLKQNVQVTLVEKTIKYEVLKNKIKVTFDQTKVLNLNCQSFNGGPLKK